MAGKEWPSSTITSRRLADWLNQYMPQRWWLVDGDPLLTGQLSFPCSSEELAAELERINGLLRIVDLRDRSPILAELIEDIQDLDKFGIPSIDDQEQVFQLRWLEPVPGPYWFLVDDTKAVEEDIRAGTTKEITNG